MSRWQMLAMLSMLVFAPNVRPDVCNKHGLFKSLFKNVEMEVPQGESASSDFNWEGDSRH